MLYFKAFLEGLADMPAADPAIRAQIEARPRPGLAAYARAAGGGRSGFGGAYSPQPLPAPGSGAGGVSRQRCTLIELARSARKRAAGRSAYRVVQMAICPQDRAVLHQRIALRFEQMMAAGLLEEVRNSDAAR